MPSPNQLLVAYQSLTDRLRGQLAANVDRAWNALPNYRDGNIDRLRRVLVPQVEANHIRVAEVTAAFQAQYARESGLSVPPVVLDRSVITRPRGVPTGDLIDRAAVNVYTVLSRGGTMTQAVTEGGRRLRTMIGTDSQLVRTKQSRHSLSRSDIAFYRRQLGPGENCALCVTASTNRYSIAELLPIHDNCRCTVVPVPARFRFPRLELPDEVDHLPFVGATVDELVADLVVRQHSEIGPVLGWSSQSFTELGDL